MNYEPVLQSQLQAPKDNAEIEILCRRPELGEREFVEAIECDPKMGVIGDRWSRINWVQKADGTPDERNQISILPKRIYEAICLDSDDAIHPGDTIIADFDTSFENLPIGSRLKIGEVTLEVSDVPNYACEKWRDRYGMTSWKFVAHKDLQKYRLRGILCQIMSAGTINRDDKIEKLSVSA